MPGANVVWQTLDEAATEVSRLMHAVEDRARGVLRDIEAAHGTDPQHAYRNLSKEWPDLAETYMAMHTAIAELDLARPKLSERLDAFKRERQS